MNVYRLICDKMLSSTAPIDATLRWTGTLYRNVRVSYPGGFFLLWKKMR